MMCILYTCKPVTAAYNKDYKSGSVFQCILREVILTLSSISMVID